MFTKKLNLIGKAKGKVNGLEPIASLLTEGPRQVAVSLHRPEEASVALLTAERLPKNNTGEHI